MSTGQIPKPGTTRKPQIGGHRAPQQPAPDPAWKNPTLGLAKPTVSAPEVETVSGVQRTDTLERGQEQQETGTFSQTSERNVGVLAGTKTTSESSSHSFDGATTTDSSSASETMVGVETAASVLKKHGPDEISVAIETLARAGAFGEAKKTAAIRRGMARASMEAQGELGAGFEAKMALSARIDRTGAIPALSTMIEASARAGLWAEGSFTGIVGLGPVEAKIMAEARAFLGAEAQMEASAFFDKQGVGASFEGSVLAGAKVEAKGSLEVGIPNKVSIELGGEVEAMAGAEAKLAAGLTITLRGVSATFKAEAFAGAKASATGRASVKLMGKKILTAQGTVEVSAGAGGTVKGEFTFIDGKLKISAKVAATIGIGAGADGEVEVDLGALATIIYAKLYEVGKASTDPVVKEVSPDFERTPLTDPVEKAKKHSAGYEAVYDSFLAYARKKTMQGKGISGTATPGPGVSQDNEGIKRERVQAIITEVSPLLRADMAYLETDEGIQQAALDAFGGYLSGIQVQHGAIRQWTPAARVDAAAHREKMQGEEKMREARDPLLDELHGYCRKKMTEGRNGVKQDVVQAIIDKHYAKLQAVFTKPGEPDEVVGFVADEMVKRYLGEFAVKNGKITKFVVDETKTKQVKDEAAGELADAALGAAMGALDGSLTAYVAQVLAKPGGTIDGAALTKLVKKATAKVSGELAKPGTDEMIKLRLLAKLGGAVQFVEVTAGTVSAVVLKDGGLAAMRTQAAGDKAAAAKQECADKFGRALSAYRNQKTAKGNHGLKQTRVQTMLDTALKSEPAWKASGEADAALRGAAEQALGDDLKGIGITKGVVETFNYDNAKLADDKADLKENGAASLGGEEDDNQRRSLVTAAVRGPLKALCDSFRTQSEEDPTARLDLARLQVILDKGVKDIRADANTPAGNEALEEALKLYLPMITFVKVDGLKITGLRVNNVAFADKADKAATGKARAAIGKALKAKKGSMTLALANEIIAKHKAKLATLPADELDMVLQIEIVSALGPLLDATDPVTVAAGVVTKLALKPKR